MKPSEGDVYCWTVRYGVRKWASFHTRKEARAFRRDKGGVIYALVRSH